MVDFGNSQCISICTARHQKPFYGQQRNPVNGIPYSIERLLAGKDGTIQRLQAECFSLKHAGVPAKAQLDEKSLAAFCIVSVC